MIGHRIVLLDGDLQIDSFDWSLGLEAAINVTPDFMAITGATLGCVIDGAGVEVWARYSSRGASVASLPGR